MAFGEDENNLEDDDEEDDEEAEEGEMEDREGMEDYNEIMSSDKDEMSN